MVDAGTYQAINVLLQVLIWSLSFATPIIVIIIMLYQYDKYKKHRDKEKVEAERIIVKMNKDIIETTKSINLLKPQETELKLAIESMRAEHDQLQKELAEIKGVEDIDLEHEEAIDVTNLSVKELHGLAKERKIRGYSRMPKAKLIELLS